MFIANFNNIFEKYSVKLDLIKSDFFLDVIHVNYVHIILFFLRDHESCLFKSLIDIFVVDYPDADKRFVLVYCLLSLKYNTRVYIKMHINELTIVPSITNVYKSACWMEREVWDMNGIFFENHPDLRRLLTDYGFEGHPLRKDFPLSGYVEIRYDESQKRVLYESIEMAQEYRIFHFKSSWE